MGEGIIAPSDIPPSALLLLNRLRAAGHVAYLCGGAVRDLLLGRAPKDWDLATDATPNRLEAILAGAARLVPVGRAFGVMTAVVDGQAHEIATFRSETGYADGRRPDAVVFSSPQEDARRRDFTINALFYDPATERVLDFVGGLDDLRRGVLRTVGDAAERFREDHLRLLRTVRFAGRTGFAVDPATWRAARDLAPLAASVAPERVAAEIEAMLTGGQAAASFRLLDAGGLLAAALPEVARLRGVPQPPEFHPEGDVWTHTLLMLEMLDAAFRADWDASITPADPSDLPDWPVAALAAEAGAGPSLASPAGRRAAVRACHSSLDADSRLALAWGVLLHDLGKPDTITHADRIRFNCHDRVGAELAGELMRRLRRARDLREAVEGLVGRHMHFAYLRRMKLAKLRRWLRAPDFPSHLELHRLDCEGSHRMLANWAAGFGAWRAEKARPPEVAPLITGRDLLAMGLSPGPLVGQWLARAEDARLENVFQTREAGLQWLRAQLRRSGAFDDAENEMT